MSVRGTRPLLVALAVSTAIAAAGCAGRATAPSASSSAAPVVVEVTTGVASSTRPRVMSCKPVRRPFCGSVVALARITGAQLSWKFDCTVVRTTFMPHVSRPGL